MEGPKFVLDANVFIEAARRYYAFDLAPGFWESLIRQTKNGRVQSIDRVKKELERGKDQLAEWAKGDFDFGFDSTDEVDVIELYSEIVNWVQSQNQFTGAAKAEFARGADGWLVAYARVKGSIVVTQEVLAPPEAKIKVKIPNVCQAFNLPYVDTFEMLRRLGVKWSR